jgi:hypothetical protein
VYTAIRFTHSVKHTIAVAPLVFGTGARSELLSNVEQPIQKVALPDLAVDVSPVFLELLAPLPIVLTVSLKGCDPCPGPRCRLQRLGAWAKRSVEPRLTESEHD